MPSIEHETPIALVRDDPDFVAALLGDVFGVAVPDYATAHPHATDVSVIVPATYRADAMLVYADERGRPVFAVVLEVQRGWDPGKRRTWPLYLTHLEAELGTDAALVVYCPDARIADRYRALLADSALSLRLRPFFLTPNELPIIDDPARAREHPALAVLALLAHAHDPGIPAVFPALAAAVQAAESSRVVAYYDIVAAGLPPHLSKDWRAFMTTTVKHRFLSEHLRTLEAEAIAKGEATAVLTVLEARGIPASAGLRERILATTDTDLLDTWLRRAATATVTDADQLLD